MKNIFTRFIDFIKKILLKNVKKKQNEVEDVEKIENNKTRFSKELRQYSEELDLINEINSNPSKLFEMSELEFNNALRAIKKRDEFLNQRIFELKQQILKIRKKDN